MKKKADYQKMLLKMIRPLTRHYTDDGSGLYLGAFSAGYGNRIAEMEGFSRVLCTLTKVPPNTKQAKITTAPYSLQRT